VHLLVYELDKLNTFSLPLELPYCVLQTSYIVVAKLYHLYCSGDRETRIHPSRTSC